MAATDYYAATTPIITLWAILNSPGDDAQNLIKGPIVSSDPIIQVGPNIINY